VHTHGDDKQEVPMQLDKQQIMQFLRNRGEDQKANQADEQLPQKVDTDNSQHQSILQQLGINPMDLAKQFMGGKGIPGL
jgi:hypothetical protein